MKKRALFVDPSKSWTVSTGYKVDCYNVHSDQANLQCHVSFIHRKHLLSVLTANAALLQHRARPQTRSHQS